MERPTLAVRWTAFGISAIYTLLLWLLGFDLESLTQQLLSLLPSAFAAVVIAWDLFLWRWRPFSFFTRRPRLDGLWHVVLKPTDQSHIPDGGNTGPIESYLVVAQTFWSLYARLLTVESASWSRAHFWSADDGAPTEHLTFTYRNEPKAEVEERSTTHLGTCTLRPESKSPSVVPGTYFTDRYTRGDMSLKLLNRSTGLATFAEANSQRRGAD